MAETANQRLKAVQADQVKLNKERKFVFASPPTARTALSSQDNSHVLVEQLAQTAPQLYPLSETVFSAKSVPSFGCSMESSVDEARARIIDLVARVPVEDSVKQVSDAMWQDLNSLSQMPDKSYRYWQQELVTENVAPTMPL
ncbi:hypothetical protein GQ600_23756 [Phytophthora cactorum]|nr:hypothetical protein GQ600_23756 [Phytophthora cactorum]